MDVTVINENTIEVSIDPPQTIVVEVDQGKSGRGIESITYQPGEEGFYLLITYTDGTTQLVGPITSSGPASALSGGVAGDLPYQSAPSVTNFLSIGTPGQVLVAGATLPEYTSDLTNISSIDFDQAAGVTVGPGQMAWNSADGTLDIGMGYDAVIQQVGLESFYRIKASAAISNGQLVMFTGAVGASGVITGAPAAAGLSEGLRVMGVATMDIPRNDFGYITNFGLVRGINTTGSSVGETWADGDILYYNPAVVGGLTKFRPESPAEVVVAAAVTKAGAGGSGSLFIRISFYPRLTELSDVYARTPSNNDLLVWSTANARWQTIAAAPQATNIAGGAADQILVQSGAGATTFVDAPTVDDTFLKWSSGAGFEWAVNPLGTVTSVAMTTPTGLTVSGSPITTSGTLDVTLETGYSIPTTASQANWDTAYSDRLKWDGGATGLDAATGRTSLGLGTAATRDAGVANGVAELDGSGTVPTSQLANTGVSAGSYTNASLTVDSKGRLTAASSGTAPVTSVGATAPIASTGGTTPTVSISQAGSTTDGYLSSTDWNTFNNKSDTVGTVTSIDVSGGSTGLTSSGGPVTSSGTITLAGTLAVTNGGTGATDAATALTNLGAYPSSNPSGYTSNTGTVTSVTGGSYLTGGTITTSGTLAVDAASANTASTVVARDASGNFSAGTITADLSGNATTATTASATTASATFDNSGTGAASGATFNGSTARTISYNTVGAPSTTGTNASGTWDISITGNAATATSATSATSATTATNLAAGAANQIPYQTGSGATTFATAPTVDDTYLKWSSGGGFVWSTAGGTGTVTSVDVSGGTTGLTTSGGPVTSSGTITLAGTLAVANGGTGATDAATALTNLGAYPSSNPSGYTSNAGTVTSVTGGSYLTGGTITSSGTLAVDATSANTASKIVARDASGDFSAGTITANLSGNATTATTAGNVSGTVAIANGGTGATSAANALTNLGAVAAAGGITTISIVASLPGSPDANTLYIVTS